MIFKQGIQWPGGRKRTGSGARRPAQFGRMARQGDQTYKSQRKLTIAEGASRLERELKSLGARDVLVFSELRVSKQNWPLSDQRIPLDPGVVVTCVVGKREYTFCCDTWTLCQDNMAAIAKHIEALRGQERWGVANLEEALAGHAALPASIELAQARAWWEVLEVDRNASPEVVKGARNGLALKWHPDKAPADQRFEYESRMSEINRAWDTFMALEEGKNG